MIRMCCDRCKEEIKGTTYYTINIYAEDINPKSNDTWSYTTAVQNIQTNTLAMFNAQKQYCEKCKNEIERFVDGYVEEV